MLAGIIPMGAIFLESYLSMVWHVMIRFGKWDEIIAEPLRTDTSVFPGTIATQHYARGVAYASKGMVPEAEAEQVKFKEALQNPALAGRVLHNNKIYQDPAEGPCLLLVSDAILDGEIEYRRQFLAKAAGEPSDFTAAFAHIRRGVDLSLNLAYNEPWGQAQPVRHILGALLLEQGHIEEVRATRIVIIIISAITTIAVVTIVIVTIILVVFTILSSLSLCPRPDHKAEAVYRADIKLWKDNMVKSLPPLPTTTARTPYVQPQGHIYNIDTIYIYLYIYIYIYIYYVWSLPYCYFSSSLFCHHHCLSLSGASFLSFFLYSFLPFFLPPSSSLSLPFPSLPFPSLPFPSGACLV
jgi:hypothetical protein